jgi:hypothetical protein
MRHLTAAILAAAFAAGSISVALADCPGHAKDTTTTVSVDQGTTVATPVVIPQPAPQSGS